MAKKLSKDLQGLYFPPSDEPVTVRIPKMGFLMVDGQGSPNDSKDYMNAIGALYSVAFTAKFTLKKADKSRDFKVMPLESLWRAENNDDFLTGNKEKWCWTAMIMVPEHVTRHVVKDTIQQLKKKGKDKELPGLQKLRWEAFEEGLRAQIMHIGPYSAERPIIEKLHKYIEAEGHGVSGRHHEIYLGDPRRTKTEKLKTVIRQPMK